jgi:hypothetical protein
MWKPAFLTATWHPSAADTRGNQQESADDRRECPWKRELLFVSHNQTHSEDGRAYGRAGHATRHLGEHPEADRRR